MNAIHNTQSQHQYMRSPILSNKYLKRKMLTLYLSTMGNLMGPSLDRLKFGKLSRCGINGNPLKWKKTKIKCTCVLFAYKKSKLISVMILIYIAINYCSVGSCKLLLPTSSVNTACGTLKHAFMKCTGTLGMDPTSLLNEQCLN